MSVLPASVRDRVVDVGYTAGWRVIRALPEPVARFAFARGADLATRRAGGSIQQLRRNLARVTGRDPGPVGGPTAPDPELDELVRAAMRSYARYWMETFRLPSMAVGDVLARTRTEGYDGLETALAEGRGAVLALPHSGNWDVAGLWLINQGQPFTTVAERLQPESLFDQFVAYREGLGMEVIALTGGPRPPMDVLAERLATGGVVCLVADRDLSRHGIDVDFFGEPTRMPAGPALLAARTGAALFPVHLHYRPGGWEQWVGPRVELGQGRLRPTVTRATQDLADAFAGRIAQHPVDWHMLQKLWLADLDPARLRPSDETAA